jgi:hypothetical protein
MDKYILAMEEEGEFYGEREERFLKLGFIIGGVFFHFLDQK